MFLRTLPSSILVSVLSLSPLTGVAFAASFSDVPSTHVHAEAIAYVKAEGIVDGYADGTFRANQTINRAEFTKIILEATQDRATCASASQTFSDVPSDAWFSAYVCRAKELSVIGGYPDGTFRPGSAINFAEAAKIIAGAQGLSMSVDASVWYRGSVEALGERKAIPVSIDSFEKKLTRGEMAEMIWRLKTEVTNKPSRTYGDLRSVQPRVASPAHTYERRVYGFSIQYPGDWRVYEISPGGRRGDEYFSDFVVEFLRPAPSEPYSPLNGMRILVFQNETLTGYLDQWMPTGEGQRKRFQQVYPGYEHVQMNGFEGIAYDRVVADMRGSADHRSYVLQVGSHVLEIEVPQSELSTLKPFIDSLKTLP